MNFTEDVLSSFPAARIAMVTVDESGTRREWGFGELNARAAGLAGALEARGVSRGDVVMTLIGNRAEWVLAMLACFRIGAVALPCNTQLRRADLAHRVAVAGPVLALGEERWLEQLPDGVDYMDLNEIDAILDEERPQAPPAMPADLDPGDPALIVFTSGTTGPAQAAVHPQRYLLGQRLQAERWLGARPGELAWCTAATGWSKSARNAFIAPWLAGAAAYLHEGRFDPDERLGICEREGINVLCQAPTEYRMLAKRTELRPVRSLRRLVSAGEPLNAGVIAAFRDELGLDIHDGYGQTETGALTGALTGDEVRDGSMGKPLPGIELRVEDGELQLRTASCPTFFSHYLGAEPFAGEWWHTGDLVRADDDGYLWFEGRSDDVILSSGYRIGPFEVESALVSHPAVSEAAAVAAPDAERGAIVRAIVVLRSGEPGDELARELQEHVKEQTAPYKYPRIVEFADSLPKTASGKIKRAELRAAAGGA
ncbi:MAG TPA: AMP-binding protein [Solirubrobacterales bacterium]|jgi:acetyl-CoA synthetase|nr:AMP-binding protein [Solirubrobacterales bacterium]